MPQLSVSRLISIWCMQSLEPNISSPTNVQKNYYMHTKQLNVLKIFTQPVPLHSPWQEGAWPTTPLTLTSGGLALPYPIHTGPSVRAYQCESTVALIPGRCTGTFATDSDLTIGGREKSGAWRSWWRATKRIIEPTLNYWEWQAQ